MRYFLSFCLLLSVAYAESPATIGNPVAPEALQGQIMDAYDRGERKITVTPGVYVLTSPLTLREVKDAEISAYGVEIAVDHPSSGALMLENCQGVQFKGAVLRYARPHTGQAKILAIGADDEGEYCDIQLEPGFPKDATFAIAAVVDGSTLLPKTDGGSARILMPHGEADQFRLYWKGEPSWKKFPDTSIWPIPGDYLVCRGPGGMMCYAKGSQSCTLEDLTIYWGGQFGFYESHGSSANRYIRNTITYGPLPPGARMRALVSQSADGVHSGGSIVGPTLEGCVFEGQMDDGVNIHGSFYQIARSRGSVVTMGFPSDFLDAPREYHPGDAIYIYDLRKHIIAARKIVSINETNFVSSRQSRHSRFANFPMRFVDLTLDEEIDVPYDSVAWFPARCGAGYRIIGCTIRNSWSRGFLLKADEGTVTNNIVERTPGAGIVLSTELNWAEAGYSRKVTIEGNTLRNCGFLNVAALGEQAGGLVVTSTGMEGHGHENIQIRNNTFENIDLTNIIIRHARNVVISDNKFINPLQRASSTGDIGRPFGIDSQAIIWIDDSAGITLSGNEVIKPGSYARSGLSRSPSTEDITGSLDLPDAIR